jgi:predicted ATP-dependent endonuclease of OLD family
MKNMLSKINIKNYKSIADDTLELGRVNVLIGENGCGKSNILEAIAMASSASQYNKIDIDLMHINGIRVAKPALLRSSFAGEKTKKNIELELTFSDSEKNIYKLFAADEGINATWVRQIEKIHAIPILNKMQDILLKNPNIELSALNELLEKEIAALEYSKNGFMKTEFPIFTLNTPALRGLPEFSISRKGLNGERLDEIIAELDTDGLAELKSYAYMISWLKDFLIDEQDNLKKKGFKGDLSKSKLYFRDVFMQMQNNTFSVENANEGVLHVLFYLATLINKNTPAFFGVDNIETALNPHLCRELMSVMCELAKKHDKQFIATTHNPAILDGLNLHDDEVRLFRVYRDNKGATRTERIKLKPQTPDGQQLKLSELWTRGYLGAISQNF